MTTQSGIPIPNFVIRGSKRYRLLVYGQATYVDGYVLEHIFSRDCQLMYMYTYSRAYLRGTVVLKYRHYRSTMVLIMIQYYPCWISYPTCDMDEDQVKESMISIDIKIGTEYKKILQYKYSALGTVLDKYKEIKTYRSTRLLGGKQFLSWATGQDL